MDLAAAHQPPPLPAPWPAAGQSQADWEREVARIRSAHEQWAAELAMTLTGGAPAGDPTEVGGVVDVVDGPVRARVYTPAGSGPFPAVVMLHGGGWWIGGGEAGLRAADPACRIT